MIRKFTILQTTGMLAEDRREKYYHDRIQTCGEEFQEFDRLSTEAALNLLYTYDVYHQIGGRYLATFGLSKSTFNILMLLRHAGSEGMLLHDLGEMLLVSRANITGLIDHLVEKGYVRRVVDEEDRRGRYAQITEQGRQLLNQFLPVHFKNLRSLLSGLTCEEKTTFIELLKKARKSLVSNSKECEETISVRRSA